MSHSIGSPCGPFACDFPIEHQFLFIVWNYDHLIFFIFEGIYWEGFEPGSLGFQSQHLT